MQLQRVMINALAGQTLYATLTIVQGAQTREIDIRLSESLALATRVGAPLFITRSLFENAATLDFMTQASESSWQELESRRNDVQKLGREERLLLEEDVRGVMAPNARIRPTLFWARLWSWLLESLTVTQDNLPAAHLRTLDIATTFPTREVTWDEQPMIAIRVPGQAADPHQREHQPETAWILVRPGVWERITQMLQRWQKPEHNEEQEPARTVANPFPDGLPPEIQQRVEERLAWLIEEPELRTALLRNPQGTVMAWKGADTQETVQRFNSKVFSEHRRLHAPLANQGDLDRRLGDQPQKVVPAFGSKKAIRQDLPKEAGGLMGAGVHRSGWQMMVIFAGKNARDLKEETHQRLHQVRQELEDILTQRLPG